MANFLRARTNKPKKALYRFRVATAVTDRNTSSANPRRVDIYDRFTLTQRVISPEGYLTAPVQMARTGVQQYTAKELGLDKEQGMDGRKVVRLYRPHEEVFAADSMASFEAKPVTLNHPPEDVTSANWKDYSVGDVHGVAAAGKFMTGKIIVRDKAAIDAIQKGKGELSNGYSFELDLTPGTSPDGEDYDGIQRNIQGNHLAVVDYGRAGPACRIADQDNNPTQETSTMATNPRKVIVDGIGVDLEDTHAAIVEKALSTKDAAIKSATDARVASEERATKAEAALKVANDAAAKSVADHLAEVEKLKAQILSPEQIEALATERAQVVTDAASISPEIKGEGKTVAAIRVEALQTVIAGDEASKAIASAVLGKVELDKAEAGDVRKAFDAVVAARGKSTPVKSEIDKTIGKALAGNDSSATVPALTGRAAMIYRSQHNGKLPGEAN